MQTSLYNHGASFSNFPSSGECSSGGPKNVRLSGETQGSPVTLLDRLDKGSGGILAHQVHSAAAESGPGHACPEHTGLLEGNFDQYVKLFGAHLIVAAQTFVRSVHELPKAI